MSNNSKKIVASIQISPVCTSRENTYGLIEKAIQYIRGCSEVEYRLGIMAAYICGYYEDVMKVINDVQNEILLDGDNEYLINICIHRRNNFNIEIIDKENRFVGI